MPKVWNPEPKDVKQYMYFIEWTPESLRETRRRLGLTQEDIAEVMGLTKSAISCLERRISNNVWAIQLYGIILERYIAGTQGYIPAFRKIGESTFLKEGDA